MKRTDRPESRRRSSLAAGGGTLVGGAFGVVLPFVLSASYGTGLTDSYFLVFSAISFVTAMVISVVEGVCLPFVSEARSEGTLGRALLRRLVVRSLFLAVTLALVAAGLVAAVAVPLAGFDAPDRADALRFLLCLAPLPAVAAFSATFAAVHYAHDRFALTTSSQAMRSATALLVAVVGGGEVPLEVVALALSVGEALRAGLLATRARPLLGQQASAPRELGLFWRTALPYVASLALVGVNPVIDKVVAGGSDVGDITTLELAEKLFYVPSVLFSAMVGLVFVSSWSRTLARTSDASIVGADFWRAQRIVVLAGAGVVVTGIVLTQLLGGVIAGFAGVPASTFVPVLSAYLLGLPFTFMIELSARLVIVLRETRFLPLVSIVAVAVNVAADLVGDALLGVTGIALASSLTRLVVAVVFLVLVRHALQRRARTS